MKTFRNTISALAMIAVISFGTTFANAGILVAGKTSSYTPTTTTRSNPCGGTTKTRTNSGILVAGFAGILVAGYTGILVAGATGTRTNCGILVAG